MLPVSGLPMTRSTQQERFMTTQQTTFLIPPYGTATLALPEVLTPDAFARLHAAIGAALGGSNSAGGALVAPDAGAIEFASWFIQLQ
jgi:hypothetical protein